MRYSYFLAPAWYDEDGFRTTGFSSTVNKKGSIPGCRYLWPEGMAVQVEQPTTPEKWDRITVAKIPLRNLVPYGVYAHLCLFDVEDVMRVTPSEVIFIAGDAESPPEWERIVIAVIDPKFRAAYGDSYVAQGNGLFYSKDYRSVVHVPQGREGTVPGTWSKISEKEAGRHMKSKKNSRPSARV